jgi:hypothetical protein
MTTTISRVVILAMLYVATICGDCSKRKVCFGTSKTYSFAVNGRAFPDSDSLFVNDTIWVEINFPTTLIDNNTQTTINYTDAENLGTDISFIQFIGGSINNPGAVAAANDFDYKLILGTFVFDSYLPEKNKDYLFVQLGSEYKFKLGIIPKKVGNFSFAFGDAANVYTKNNKCDKAGFSITFANTSQHLYFYEQNRPGYTPSEYERTHMYCFKVK